MKPRASASFCHCPKLSSTPSGQVGPSCVSSPAVSRSTTSVGAAALDGRLDSRPVVQLRYVANADGVASLELEPEEILKRTRQAQSPGIRRHPREFNAVDQDPPARGLVQPAEELHQRRLAGAILAHDRDHRAGHKMQVDVLEDQAVGPGIGEGNMFKGDRRCESHGPPCPAAPVVATSKRCLRQANGRRAALFGGTLHARPPGRSQHRRQRKKGQKRKRRVNRD